MEKSLNKIKFQVETKRVLEILSNEIYDSPYALLRENIQNAYDAILMRKSLDEGFEGEIKVEITKDLVKIIDNGIGMTEDQLRENFWKAGSSGKRGNALAEKAGVIGTFGIGAMANFGVCEKLEVVTRNIDSNLTFQTIAIRDNLSISEDCIELFQIESDMEIGTTLIAYLDNDSVINYNGAIDYLRQYVEYLPIKVLINGENCSQKKYHEQFLSIKETSIELEFSNQVNEAGLICKIEGVLAKNNSIKLTASNIIWQDTNVIGEIVLEQGRSHIMGLRNYFGMASVPINQTYNWGGIVNLSILQPTAGREALSRESISFVQNLLGCIEKVVSEEIANSEIVDKNPYFMNYLVNYGRYELAKNICILLKPDDNNIPLKNISEIKKQKPLKYYSGNDSSIIQLHANENTNLLILSQSNPRRNIQLNYLNQYQIQPINNDVQVSKIYERNELELSESAIILRMISILNDDYFLSNCQVNFAEITHQLPLFVRNDTKGDVCIFLSKNAPSIIQLKQTYENAYEIFTSFLKDFVRSHIYSKIAQFVPSSTRQGADALQKILSKNRELYDYDFSEQGELESLLSDYLKGAITLPEVLKQSKTITKTHTQQFTSNQVGTIEDELPNIIHDSITRQDIVDNASDSNDEKNIALPPILRLDSETTKKLITTSMQRKELNMFKMFLGLSDQIYKRDKDFFLEPHTTKIIWGGHKVVYIFSHISSRLTIYYDIELKEKLKDETIGGNVMLTTTIVTGNRIFVPIPEHLESSFYIEKGKKEFFVRYDLIVESMR